MVNKILEASGFVKNETYKKTRFIKPPKKTYAVYNDDYSVSGSDDVALLIRKSITIEVYEYRSDKEVIRKIENSLDNYYPLMVDGWKKEDRYYIDSENIYQTVYTFEYIEKRGV